MKNLKTYKELFENKTFKDLKDFFKNVYDEQDYTPIELENILNLDKDGCIRLL